MSQRVLLNIVAEFLAVIGLLFIPAGIVGWIAGWVLVALLYSISLPVVRMLVRNAPKLLQERMSSLIQRNQPLQDKMLLPVLMLIFVAWLVLMPLDAGRPKVVPNCVRRQVGF